MAGWLCADGYTAGVTAENDTRAIGSYAAPMNLTPHKEPKMKTTATHTMFKLATLLAVAAPIAATGGRGCFKILSDETQKQNITEIDDALARIRQL